MNDRRFKESEVGNIMKENMVQFDRWARSRRRDPTFKLNIPEELLAVLIPSKLLSSLSHLDLFPVINHRSLSEKDQELDFSILNRQTELLDIGLRVFGQSVGPETLVLLKLFGTEEMRGMGVGIEVCDMLAWMAKRLGFQFIVHTVSDLDLTFHAVPHLFHQGWVPYRNQIPALADRSRSLRKEEFIRSTILKDLRSPEL